MYVYLEMCFYLRWLKWECKGIVIGILDLVVSGVWMVYDWYVYVGDIFYILNIYDRLLEKSIFDISNMNVFLF